MSKCHIITFIFLIASCVVYSQDIPVIPENRNANEEPNLSTSDSTTIVDNTFFDIFTGNPGKAAFYGLIIPGGGQIYNKKWWKLPLVYGLEGYLVYSIVSNTNSYNRYQNAYILNLKSEPYEIDGTTDIGIIKSRRDSFRKAREYAWVFFYWWPPNHYFRSIH